MKNLLTYQFNQIKLAELTVIKTPKHKYLFAEINGKTKRLDDIDEMFKYNVKDDCITITRDKAKYNNISTKKIDVYNKDEYNQLVKQLKADLSVYIK